MKRFVKHIILFSMIAIPFAGNCKPTVSNNIENTTLSSRRIDQNRLRQFLTEYSSSEEKKSLNWGKVAYAIEKDYVDVAFFLIRRGENYLVGYCEKFLDEENKLSSNKNEKFGTYYKYPFITAIRKGYNDLAIEMLHVNKTVWWAIEKKEVRRRNHTEYIEKNAAFFIALSEGKDVYSLVQTFLELGFDVDEYIYANIGKATPMYLAITFQNIDVVRLLLDHGALNSNLFYAVKSNYKEAVFLFLQYGADPLKNGALELAMQLGYDDLVDIMLSVCCD